MRFYPEGDVNYQLEKLLNKGLTFADNVKGGFLEVILEQGENEIRHFVGFKPTGYVIIYKDLEGDVYGSRVGEWTTEILYLTSSVENQMVRLFVL